MKHFVIGVHSRGFKTRARVVGLDGVEVSHAEVEGGNPFHNPDHRNAVRHAITEAASGVGLENVACVVSGMAGYQGEAHTEWAMEAMTVEGLDADCVVVNETEIAHFGAFSGAAGIVSVQGLKSNVFAVTDDGGRVGHRAGGGAADLAGNFHMAVLRREWDLGDVALVDQLSHYWNLNAPKELVLTGRGGEFLPTESARKHFVAFAERITAAALNGSELALSLCRSAAESIGEGICLAGQRFAGPTVPVAFLGSTIRSEIMTRLVSNRLAQSPTKTYAIQEPMHSPLSGAVMMALQRRGVDFASIESSRSIADAVSE